MSLIRVNMNVPEELLKRLDDYASNNYQTRSSVMCQACDQYLNAKQMQKLFSDMGKTFEKLAQIENIDEDTKKQLDEFERLAKLISGPISQV